MRQLSGMDAAFVYLETPTVPMHFGGINLYDPSTAPVGRVGYEEFLQHIASRLHLAPSARDRLAFVPLNLDHPYWISDPNFDLEYHVRHVALPRPGDWTQLTRLAGRLHSLPLDMTRPLWEFWLVEGLDAIPGLPAGSYAIIWKLHHAAADAMGSAELLSVLHDTTPDAKPMTAVEPWVADREPGQLELLIRTQFNNLRQPFRIAQLIGEAVPALRRLRDRQRVQRVEKPEQELPVPRTRFNGRIRAPHRVIEARTFDLDEVRAIKKRVEGSTVNDVVVAIVGGGLRAYLEHHDELPEASLVAAMPISVRGSGRGLDSRNQVSGMIAAIRSDLADPLERLAAIRDATRESKAVTQAVGADLLTEAANQVMPSTLTGLAMRLASRLGVTNRLLSFCNTVVTNVPGPQVPFYFAGARLVNSIGMPPVVDGMPLTHGIGSYCGTLTFAVSAPREMLPDPGFYAECLQRSFEELRDQARGPAAADSPKLAAAPKRAPRTGRA